MNKPIVSEYIDHNIASAEHWQRTLGMAWPEIWDQVSWLFNSTDTFSKMVYDRIKAERPFLCVYCGHPLSFDEVRYNPKALDDASFVDTFRCYRDRDTFPLIPPVEVGPSAEDQVALDEEAARFEEVNT